MIFFKTIDLDETGYIVNHWNIKTNIEGVFVSGDAADHIYRQAITAKIKMYGCLDAERYLAAKEVSSYRKKKPALSWFLLAKNSYNHLIRVIISRLIVFCLY